MLLTTLDWLIIAGYLVLSLGIGLYLWRKSSDNTNDFFLGGRNLPWYIAGTSMVATTFAADTPLAVTELVAQKGIAGNWLWWNMVFGGMLTVFFFARLWRRANIVTDAEFVKIRYSGKAARFLRGFRAVYIGIFMNMIVMAWINLAMTKILHVMLPDITFFGIKEINIAGIHITSYLLIAGSLLLLTAFYSSLSGLRGVSYTDSVQFVIAMTGCIVLAVFAVNHVGGILALKARLAQTPWVFDFLPQVTGKESAIGTASGMMQMSVVAIVAYLGVQWWASWYPGAEPGGGGYVAQRIMSAKNEKHSLLATLWFQIAHYAVRPWPWVLAALVALVMYPAAPDKGATFVMLIRDLLPSGLVGLLMAAFLAAFMSSQSSQTNWGTSYIINDLVKPFVKPNASEKYYLLISRITTYLLMFLSLIVATQFERISDAWKFIITCSGGIGLVLILRWYWWRINAWSEISAMIAPYLIYPILKWKFNFDFETTLIIIVAWSTLVWLSVTFLTMPTEKNKLIEFYSKVKPGGIGWKKIAIEVPDVNCNVNFSRLFANWLFGCLLILFTLFGFGSLLFHAYTKGTLFLCIAAISGVIIYRNLAKTGWKVIE